MYFKYQALARRMMVNTDRYPKACLYVPAGIVRTIKNRSKLLFYKHFTPKSLFLKDLGERNR